MNIYALFVVLAVILAIHFGFKFSNKIEGLIGKRLVKVGVIIAGFILLGMLSFDVNTSITAGRYFFFALVSYLLLYQFHFKKAWKITTKEPPLHG